MTRPRLLDLFCGAGGCTRGYQQAGFYVVGVDINPQPRYCGDEFVQADAMTFPLDGFDAIHASPPCQFYSYMSACRLDLADKYPDLIGPVRERLTATGRRYVIENVPGAPLRHPTLLCGAMFDNVTEARRAMGIDWMNRDELTEAIPPAFTEWIGAHLLAAVDAERQGSLLDLVAPFRGVDTVTPNADIL